MGEPEIWTGLRALEARLGLIEQDIAAMKNDRVHMDRRFDQIERQIDNLTTAIGKVGWFLGGLVGTSILGGFMTWVLSGGLSNAVS